MKSIKSNKNSGTPKGQPFILSSIKLKKYGNAYIEELITSLKHHKVRRTITWKFFNRLLKKLKTYKAV